MSSFDQNIISEFRANQGRVGGPFEGTDLLLLTTTGHRSGRTTVAPLAYSVTDGRMVVAASNNGSDRHPAWYLNIQANPDITIEVGDRTVPARAVVPDDAERNRLWSAHVAAMPAFATYETTTDRSIPVVVLEPLS